MPSNLRPLQEVVEAAIHHKLEGSIAWLEVRASGLGQRGLSGATHSPVCLASLLEVIHRVS
jgi:hypothetical protein